MSEHPPPHPHEPTPGRPSSSDAAPAGAPEPVAAPLAVGDVVNGDPPVPITLWHLPAGAPDVAVSGALARRLRANYAHPRAPVVDLTTDPCGGVPDGGAALVITAWPPAHGGADVVEHLAACAVLLQPGGCAAIVVTPTDIPDQLGSIVVAARQAGLTYLQHIVVAHRLTANTRHHPAASPARLVRARRHLRVHTDVLVVARPRGARA